MKRLEIVPDGWPCRFAECPPGLFVYNNTLCTKTDYEGMHAEAFCSSGETFWGGTTNGEDRKKLIVTPCSARWKEEE
jgi:hypothetical protein